MPPERAETRTFSVTSTASTWRLSRQVAVDTQNERGQRVRQRVRRRRQRGTRTQFAGLKEACVVCACASVCLCVCDREGERERRGGGAPVVACPPLPPWPLYYRCSWCFSVAASIVNRQSSILDAHAPALPWEIETWGQLQVLVFSTKYEVVVLIYLCREVVFLHVPLLRTMQGIAQYSTAQHSTALHESIAPCVSPASRPVVMAELDWCVPMANRKQTIRKCKPTHNDVSTSLLFHQRTFPPFSR